MDMCHIHIYVYLSIYTHVWPLPQVMCAFTKKKVVRPKASGFNGEKEDKFKSIRCSLKANDGYLYPLDKCFFFIANKPLQVIYIIYTHTRIYICTHTLYTTRKQSLKANDGYLYPLDKCFFLIANKPLQMIHNLYTCTHIYIYTCIYI